MVYNSCSWIRKLSVTKTMYRCRATIGYTIKLVPRRAKLQCIV